MLSPITNATSKKPQKTWRDDLAARVETLEHIYPGKIGIHVKDLQNGEEFSHRANELWYVASGVKVPIALEVLRQIDEGKFSLDTKITLKAEDFIDGAGETNSHRAGAELSIRFLIEQMLIHSDNTASDLLIKQVGLDKINACVSQVVPEGFNKITTLADVRRLAYSRFHGDAMNLSNQDIRSIRTVKDERGRVAALGRVLNMKPSKFNCRTQDAAFASYYETKMNSAALTSYTYLLEKILEGELLSKTSHEFLLETMLKVETGKNRIKAGFPGNFAFAHKTGTQHARVCDFGIAWDPTSTPVKKVIISACTRDIKSLTIAETALKSIGKAIYASGVFGNTAR